MTMTLASLIGWVLSRRSAHEGTSRGWTPFLVTRSKKRLKKNVCPNVERCHGLVFVFFFWIRISPCGRRKKGRPERDPCRLGTERNQKASMTCMRLSNACWYWARCFSSALHYACMVRCNHCEATLHIFYEWPASSGVHVAG